MRRIHYLAGLALTLAISSIADGDDEKHCCPEALKQKLLQVDENLRELETLVERAVLSSGPPARANHDEIAGLERQVSELETLLGTLGQPGTKGSQLDELERQVGDLEKLLQERPESKVARPPLDVSGLTDLEEQIGELQRLLLKTRETQTPRKAADPVRIVTLETQIGELKQSQAVAARRHEADRKRITELENKLAESQTAGTKRITELETRLQKGQMAVGRDRSSSTDAAITRLKPRPRVGEVIQSGAKPAGGNLGFCARLRLRSKPEIPKPIGPDGANFFGVFTYKVLDGPAAGQTIRVAHGVRWGGKNTCVTTRRVGTKLILDVVPLWWYPKLNKVERIGASAPPGEVTYTPRLH